MKREHAPVPPSVQLEAELKQRAIQLQNSITAIKLQVENPADKRVKRYERRLSEIRGERAVLDEKAREEAQALAHRLIGNSSYTVNSLPPRENKRIKNTRKVDTGFGWW